jgi:S-adenosylmethionine/arginine decarboxylase-like enzyme
MTTEHKHLIIRAEVRNVPRYEQNIIDWTKHLIDDIGMKILLGPYATYCDKPGNKGFTCATIIETSHVIVHTWDEQSPALVQVDVYTCGALDPQTVFDALDKWEPTKIEYKYLDREKNLKEIKID